MIIGCQEASKCQCVCDVNCPWTFVSTQLEAETVDQRENGSSCKPRWHFSPQLQEDTMCMKRAVIQETIKAARFDRLHVDYLQKAITRERGWKRMCRDHFFSPQTPPCYKFLSRSVSLFLLLPHNLYSALQNISSLKPCISLRLVSLYFTIRNVLFFSIPSCLLSCNSDLLI